MKRNNHVKSNPFFILILLTLLLIGCTSKEPVNERESGETDRIQIGLSLDSLVVERWERDRDIFVSKANELGADVNVQNANGDIEEQKKQIEYFIEKGMDVIVIAAADSDALGELVTQAHKEGIKVIAYDRQINQANVDLYITFDNEKVGQMMADSLKDKLDYGANVIMVNGPTTDSNVESVDSGFKKIAEAENWEIIDETYIEGWKQELAADYINENIETVKLADAIMCGNDAIAGQVIKALSENRLAGKILVTGQDADLEACQRIVEDTQYMTVYKPINTLAETAAEYAVAMASDEKLSFTGTISNGTFYVSYVAITPYQVTKSNIDEMIIDSGFHLKSEVYLNVPK